MATELKADDCCPSGSAREKRVTVRGVDGLSFHIATPVMALKMMPAATIGIARLHNGRGFAATTGAVAETRGFAASDSKSLRKSAAQCQRRFGFFCKQRFSSATTDGFKSFGSSAYSGSRASTEA